MSSADREFVFGRYRLSERARSLRRDGEAISLASRAFDLLAVLLDNHGLVVSRDELLRRVWPDGVVHENNLAVQMSALRRVLGETRDGHPHIATVPGRGFQFVATVAVEAVDRAAAQTRVPDHRPGNMPVPLNRLIGRNSVIVDAAEALQQSRLVSLIGPSGIGKTRTALAVATELRERYPDGCWLIDLAALSEPASIAAAVATTLGLPAGADEITVNSIARDLRTFRALLVLDNCEHLRDAAAELAACLHEACAFLDILATSHERLHLAPERVCPLETLAVPPPDQPVTAQTVSGFAACELFIERAITLDRRFAVTDATAPCIADICRRLDGIPLAIELAASRQPILGLEQVRRGLDDRFRLLVGGERVVVARHVTLRGAHDWAWSLLPPAVQRTLARFSVFAGGFDLAAATIFADGDANEITDHIVMLAERSLIGVEHTDAVPRYRLLESTRAYAVQRLAELGETVAARRRHAAYFVEIFEAAERTWETRSTALWQADLLRELDNLRGALGWGFAPEGDHLIGQRLCAASTRFWHNARLVPEYRRWLDQALAAPAGEAPLMGRLWLAVARSVLGLGARAEAAERATTIARGCSDAGTTGRALALRGETLRRIGDMTGAAEVLTEAMGLLASGGAIKSCADVSQQLAVIRFHQGDLAASRAHNADALARYRATEHETGVIACLIRNANDRFAAAEIDEAVTAATEALALCRKCRINYLIELTLGNLASYETARGNWPAALTAAREALPLAIQVDDQAGVATIAQGLAEIAAAIGEAEAAASLLGYSERLFEVEQETRDPTVGAAYAALIATLEAALDAGTFATCRDIGARWTADIVLAAIDRLGPATNAK
jgi:predicted ATPase/DNA-binding winged helix-turn-helix (wHTH) protein